jgi:hypothetical protein
LEGNCIDRQETVHRQCWFIDWNTTMGIEVLVMLWSFWLPKDISYLLVRKKDMACTTYR